MALIKPRYPDNVALQHAYTLYVYQQVALQEVAFRAKLSSADLRKKIEEDGWEQSRHAVRQAYEKHVGRELSVVALRHAVPFLMEQLNVSERLSRMVNRALDECEKETELRAGALALLSKVAKDASEIGHKALGLGGVG